MQALYILGLDFGTSNLRVHRATLDTRGRLSAAPQAAPLRGSDYGALPSILELNAEKRIRAYGQPALQNLVAEGSTESFIHEFKPSLGQSAEDLQAQRRPAIILTRYCPRCQSACSPRSRFCAQCGASLPPIEDAPPSALFRYGQEEAFYYTELLMEKVIEDLQKRVYGQPLTSNNGWGIVAGVPVHWKETTRVRYEKLLERQFSNEHILLVSEPEAALFYHLWQKTFPAAAVEKWVLVVDIGAGTTDLTLCRVAEEGRRLLEAHSYGERYGGGDFDVAVSTYIAECLKAPLDGALPAPLKQEGKKLKEAFSQAMAQDQPESRTMIYLPLEGQFYRGMVSLDRPTFESQAVAGSLVEEFEHLLDRATSHFGIAASQVGLVIATGGGALWYFVEESLKKRFEGCPVVIGSEPQMAISKGLALAPTQAAPILTVSLPLSWEEAQNGCQKTIEVGQKQETIQVPARVRSGQELRIEGKGAAGLWEGPRGDLVVRLEVAKAPVRGEDLTVPLSLNWQEARKGCSKTLELGGRSERIDISAGALDGQELKLEGKGSPGENGGSPGDLLVKLQVAPEPVRGKDVSVELKLTAEEAQKGCTRTVTAEGKTEQVVIAPGAMEGAEIRVKGKGKPGEKGGAAGDLVVRLKIAAPPQPPKQQNALTASATNIGIALFVPFMLGGVAYTIASIAVPIIDSIVAVINVPQAAHLHSYLTENAKDVVRFVGYLGAGFGGLCGLGPALDTTYDSPKIARVLSAAVAAGVTAAVAINYFHPDNTGLTITVFLVAAAIASIIAAANIKADAPPPTPTPPAAGDKAPANPTVSASPQSSVNVSSESPSISAVGATAQKPTDKSL